LCLHHRSSFGIIAIALTLLVATIAPVCAADSPIPWKPGDTFSRTSVDDDVRSVLRTMLGAEGLSVIFRPSVTGKISFEFKNVPIQSAFDQILQEYGLTAQYNPDTHTVSIDAVAGSRGETVSRRFIPLPRAEYDAVRQALTNFGIGLGGIAYDADSETLAVAGDEARISQIQDLIKTLEDHPHPSGVTGEPGNLQTKVIRLRFADVGPSVRSFHGRTVTVPGILETLQAMLGTTANPVLPGPDTAANPLAPNLPAQSVGGPQSPAGLGQILQNAVPPPVQSALATAQGAPPRPAQPRVAISIDQRTNSVIVRGTPEQIAAVENVVAQLDQPVKMVEIEVIIATAQVGVASELGITWRGLAGINQNKSIGFDTGTSSGQASSTSGFDAISLLPVANTPGGVTASFITRLGSGFLQAQLQALAQENKARILSAPNLVTLDNITARITRSADIYVPVSNGALSASGLSQIQTGLTLEITPSIVPVSATSKDRLLRLSLNATDSSPSSNSGGQITVASHEVQTDVLVPDGGTLVLGGLFDHTHTEAQTGVPLLKDIPVLGQLFRDNTTDFSLGETIFFITPTIVNDAQVASHDVALSAEAVATIANQRKTLRNASSDLDSSSGKLPHSSIDLEEDQ
jgi:type III secretion protein C